VTTDADQPRAPFVPDGFEPPGELVCPEFVLEPLGPQHNVSDHAAWSSSVEHIRASPGWAGSSWPHPMSLDDNLRDLEMHARHFTERRGFTYTVLDPASREVIGCVYIYPSKTPEHDAHVRSWVTASRSELDLPLRRAVAAWLAGSWPFARPAYAVGGDPG
jgi:hypothetical protein